jgi:hypothetical protein
MPLSRTLTKALIIDAVAARMGIDFKKTLRKET